MNKILVILLILISNMANAQNNTRIIGLYSLGSSSPEGGSHLFVLENGKYAITYFGGIQVGHWEFVNNEVCKFSPNVKEQEFELFGRHNKDLNDSVKVFFIGFEESQTFIHVGTAKGSALVMKRVFNADANCFSFPYTHVFKADGKRVSLMSKEYNQKSKPVVTFENPEGYNDFVAYFFHHDNSVRPFLAKFNSDTLYFEDGVSSQKSPLDEEDEDIGFIKDFVNKETDVNQVYFNPSYNMFEGDINESHVFNEQKGAFIDTLFYAEGAENVQSDEAFDNMSFIYSFERLKESTSKTVKIEIDENPLFWVVCD